MERSPIALAQVKTGNTSETCYIKSVKSDIL